MTSIIIFMIILLFIFIIIRRNMERRKTENLLRRDNMCMREIEMVEKIVSQIFKILTG